MREDFSRRFRAETPILQKGYWIRFVIGFAVAFIVCLLRFRTATLGQHLLKVTVVSSAVGYAFARFGDSAAVVLLRFLRWIWWW